jgi:hypothetical protein
MKMVLTAMTKVEIAVDQVKIGVRGLGGRAIKDEQ